MNMNEFEVSLRNKIEQRLITMSPNQQIDFLVGMVVNTTVEAVKRLVVSETEAGVAKEAAKAAMDAKEIVSYSYDTLLHRVHDAMAECYDNGTLPEELEPILNRTSILYSEPQMVKQ